jgi:ATP-dependent RNA helicase DDX5/DBP2
MMVEGRWASSDNSYGGQGYGSGYGKRSTDTFNNSSFGNQAGGGSSFHSRFVSISIPVVSFDSEYQPDDFAALITSHNNQTGGNASFAPG